MEASWRVTSIFRDQTPPCSELSFPLLSLSPPLPSSFLPSGVWPGPAHLGMSQVLTETHIPMYPTPSFPVLLPFWSPPASACFAHTSPPPYCTDHTNGEVVIDDLRGDGVTLLICLECYFQVPPVEIHHLTRLYVLEDLSQILTFIT